MAYEKKTIAPLQGFAATPRPDLLQDSQASDMLNLRFDKLGYLVNRNGVRAFELDTAATVQQPSISRIAGATAIGEYIMSHFITTGVQYEANTTLTTRVLESVTNDDYYGTNLSLHKYDRFMVYGVRTYKGEPLPDAPNAGVGNVLMYCLIPLSEMPESRADWDHVFNVNNTGKRMVAYFIAPENQDGSKGSILVAPARRLSRSDDDTWVDPETGHVDDQNWINHYQQISQLKFNLVIADRTNGDLVVVNEFDEAEPGEVKSDILRMRYNCQSLFDIDIVKQDYQLGATEENGSGVESGLALYKLYPDKRDTVEPFDGHKSSRQDLIGSNYKVIGVSNPYPSDNWTQSDDIYKDVVYDLHTSGMDFISSSGTFLRGFQISYDVNGGGTRKVLGISKVLNTNKSTEYIFSNIQERTQFNSILHNVSFTNEDIPKTYDDEGRIENNNAADVFIWDAVRLTYKPCYGKDEHMRLMRYKDRDYSKAVPVVPKTVKLKTRVGIDQEVPLGSWAYRFVWDLGDGEFTSPSAPMFVGDILWSVIPDESMATYGSPERFCNYEGDGSDAGVSGFSNNLVRTPFLRQSGTADEMRYTTIFNTVKSALYDSGFIFSDANTPQSAETLITIHHPENTIQMNNVLGEIAEVTIPINSDDRPPIKHDDASITSISYVKLSVVLTKDGIHRYSLNSLFTDTGVGAKSGIYRGSMNIQSAPTFVPNTLPQAPPGVLNYTLVFPGDNTPYSLWGHQNQPVESYQNIRAVDPLGNIQFTYGTQFGVVNLEDYAQFDKTGYLDGQDPIFRADARFDIIKHGYDVLFNYVRDFADDTNNTDDSAVNSFTSIMRIVDRHAHRLLNMKSDIPPEVKDRILLQGMAEILPSEQGDYGICIQSFDPEKNSITYGDDASKARTWQYHTNGMLNNTLYLGNSIMRMPDRAEIYLAYDKALLGGDNEAYLSHMHYKNVAIPVAPEVRYFEDYTFDNVTVAIYLPGERLLIPEQLTAYFPSSLLFKAPRVKLVINSADIPRRAKRLMIFRTSASINNDWQPSQFAHVDDVLIIRDGSGVPETIEYLDTKKDTDIDFAHTPEEYDAIVHPLKSRFTRPLANIMWYAHFTETYQPYAPRGFKKALGDADDLPELAYSNLYANNPLATELMTSGAVPKVLTPSDSMYQYAGSNLNGMYVRYFLAFRDLTGQYSKLKFVPATIEFNAVADPDRAVVLFSLAGYPYTEAIDVCEVYRVRDSISSPSSTYYKIGEIKAEDEGIFVDDGTLEDGKAWAVYDFNGPISEPLIEERASDLAWSELGQPSKILYDARQPINHGDGDVITGLDITYGELLVFKERSLHRITLKNGATQIARIDQVSNIYGCIAPNTIVTYDNNTYFLSWHGLMRYNNNGFEKADGAFSHEVDIRLRSRDRSIVNPGIRDASIAINPAYRELYLNIPVYDVPGSGYDRHSDGLKGCVYVLQLDTGLVTKFQYETGDYERFVYAEDDNFPTTRGTYPRSMGRLYYTNSFGQLWSADILPKHKDIAFTPDSNYPQYDGYLRSLLYLESPTNRTYDEYQPGVQSMSDAEPGKPSHQEEIATQEVNTWWRSKVFTADDKTIIKRVRKVLAYIAKGQSPVIGAEFLNNEYLRDAYTEAQYVTNGELEFIPPRREPGFDRGERFAIHVANVGETEYQNLSFYFRAVNKWVR